MIVVDLTTPGRMAVSLAVAVIVGWAHVTGRSQPPNPDDGGTGEAPPLP